MFCVENLLFFTKYWVSYEKHTVFLCKVAMGTCHALVLWHDSVDQAHRCSKSDSDSTHPFLGAHSEEGTVLLPTGAQGRQWGVKSEAPTQHLWAQSTKLCQSAEAQ